jgi:hypothetical protein
MELQGTILNLDALSNYPKFSMSYDDLTDGTVFVMNKPSPLDGYYESFNQ